MYQLSYAVTLADTLLTFWFLDQSQLLLQTSAALLALWNFFPGFLVRLLQTTTFLQALTMVSGDIDCSKHNDQRQELDPSLHMQRAGNAKGNRRDTASSFNKSLDFGRHSVTRVKGGMNMHNSQESGLFGESFATMGESFMGDSFAYVGDNSFAVQSGGRSVESILGGDDNFSYSDSNGDDSAISIASDPSPRKSLDLSTVLDIEEDEEETRKRTCRV